MPGFDVVVVGGGHAGCEAAAAAARMGARTLLLTHDPATIGAMSCNPAFGGVGKGHLVREIDALDGLMGRAADAAGIHFKVLNRSKGPAVRGPRAQADRALYRRAMQRLLAETPNLTIAAGAVDDIELAAGRVAAVVTSDGRRISCGAVVLTAGTFLRGVIHEGECQYPAGRRGEAPSVRLADTLARLALPLARLKTGTPPRIARASIAWDALEEDRGDVEPEPFSSMTGRIDNTLVSCRITATNPATHEIIRSNLSRSAMYGGRITGPGPRYCPSIEDKIVRFAGRERHQVFLEPEGLDSPIVYPNGVSTSLPLEVQVAFIRTMRGLERAEIVQPGYAIEYDYVDPRCLGPGLEVGRVAGLFLAGQVNGTTGYEEAGAQGILAGVNAARRASGGDPVGLDRAQAYIGVLVDDLVTQGVGEPYRMFTARSEYRLSLRADNADLRLTALGEEWGCVGTGRSAVFARYATEVRSGLARATEATVSPAATAEAGISAKQDGRRRSLLDIIALGGGWRAAASFAPWLVDLSHRARAQIETEAVYAGYLRRQEADIATLRRDEAMSLQGVAFAELPSLTTELRRKLLRSQPATLGAAARIQGMTPAALTVLAFHARRESRGVSRETPP
jgi:tRNA uridine 5-carboxymethylaminomethyl modification enzyme